MDKDASIEEIVNAIIRLKTQFCVKDSELMEIVEYRVIKWALLEADGNINIARDIMQMDRNMMYKKRLKYKIFGEKIND